VCSRYSFLLRSFSRNSCVRQIWRLRRRNKRNCITVCRRAIWSETSILHCSSCRRSMRTAKAATITPACTRSIFFSPRSLLLFFFPKCLCDISILLSFSLLLSFVPLSSFFKKKRTIFFTL
jgi:hypothetical protein